MQIAEILKRVNQKNKIRLTRFFRCPNCDFNYIKMINSNHKNQINHIKITVQTETNKTRFKLTNYKKL
ncbi:hypothetical protein FACS18945_0520 [Bacteroidia bacterium]|nr:hypothetical protein FACS18945_0520 [Bacteroidia bacterium]